MIRLLAITLALAPAVAAQAVDSGGTRVVLLGTGTPNADPERSGPAVAVIVNGAVYLVDAGPGIVRRAAAAHLPMERLSRIFITHLHHDHTLGLGDLMLTPWTLGRTAPLQVYGPPGLMAMTDHLLRAYAEDVRLRLDGLEPANPTGYVVHAHEVAPGVVYRDSNVTVTAFAVPHGSWPLALGYKFVARDRTIVISGDTRASEALAAHCDGCDVLVHEVYAQAGWDRLPEDWQRYHASFHTSAVDLGRIAVLARPKLLVLYHQLPWSATPQQILEEIGRSFRGRVAYGKDLDVY